MPFGEQRQVLPGSQLLERLRSAVDQFHGAFEDALGERHYRHEVAIAHFTLAEALIAFAQIAAEVLRPVAVNLRIRKFYLVERRANFIRLHGRVRQEIGELFESAFEIDVVFPECIVGVDDQVLSHLFLGRRRNGISITISTSTGSPSTRAGVNSHFLSACTALLSSLGSTPRTLLIPST